MHSLLRRLPCSCRAERFARAGRLNILRTGSSTTEGTLPQDGNVKQRGKNDSPAYGLFPWRPAPPRPFNILDLLSFEVQKYIFVDIMKTHFGSQEEADHYWDVEFGEGVTTALYQTLRALFGPQVIAASGAEFKAAAFTEAPEQQSAVSMSPLQILMGNTPKLTNKWKKLKHSQSTSVHEEIADLNIYMDPNLALFFYEALATSRQTNKEVCYKLVELLHVEPMKIKSIFGAARTKAVQYGCSEHEIRHFLDFIFVKTSVAENEPLRIERLLTIQIDVELKCKEIFLVKDKLTDGIVQGNGEIAEVTHRLKFEAVFNSADKFSMQSEWTLIDIDDWLDGNTFL